MFSGSWLSLRRSSGELWRWLPPMAGGAVLMAFLGPYLAGLPAERREQAAQFEALVQTGESASTGVSREEEDIPAAELAAEEALYAASTSFIEQVESDAKWYGGFDTRVVGTPQHDAAIAELEEKVRAVAGAQTWTHEFPLVVPIVDEAHLTIAEGEWAGQHRVYPMWPAESCLNVTPPEGIEARLVYTGKAVPDEIPADSVRGQIAVCEMACRGDWTQAAAFGPQAILFLGSNEIHLDARTHEIWLPVSLPRIYIPEGPLAEALRRNEIPSARLLARGHWEECSAKNVYAVIPGADPSLERKAYIVAAQSDSMSFAPELAPGAEPALHTAFALNMLRHFAGESLEGRPPVNPLLFAFLDGNAINMRGMRELLGAVAVTPEDKAEYVEADRERAQEYTKAAELAMEIDGGEESLSRLTDLRYEPLHEYLRDAADLETVVLDEELQPLRLEFLHASEGEREPLRKRIDALAARRRNFLTALNKVTSPQGPAFSWGKAKQGAAAPPLRPELVPIAQEIWRRTAVRVRRQLGEAEERYSQHAMRDELRWQIRDAMGLPESIEVPVCFLFGVDINDSGVTCGANTRGDYTNAEPFLDWLERVHISEGDAVWPGRLDWALNMLPRYASVPEVCFTAGNVKRFTDPVSSFGLPSIAWATLWGFRERLDTPRDRVEAIRWDRVRPQVVVTAELLKRLAAAAEFNPTTNIPAAWSRMEARIVSPAPGSATPNTPRQDFLSCVVMGYPASNGRYFAYSWREGQGAMRRTEYGFTGADGRVFFDHMLGRLNVHQTRRLLQAYQFDEAGQIVQAVDYLNAAKRVGATGGRRDLVPMQGVVFPARLQNVFQLFDLRYLVPLGAVTIMDAMRDATPRPFAYGHSGSLISMVMRPESRWQMVLRIGITENRMLLLNMDDDADASLAGLKDAARGFPLAAALPLHPVHMGAKDMHAVDRQRIESYKAAGVTSEPIEELHNRAARLLEEADAALAKDDGGEMYFKASGALSNEVRAYQALRDLGNDVVRGAVFMLLLLVPFAYMAERLLFASERINKQIAFMGLIFAVMAGFLWAFHPAFQITAQPLIVIMAFAIIFMSLLTIGMILLKFNTYLKEMKSGLAEAGAAKTSQLGLAATAMRLGLASMRKRKLRTALTALTVVLITFALLCFTSTSTYQGERERTLDSERPVPFTGVRMHQALGGPFYGQIHAILENFFAHVSLDGNGRGEGVEAAYRHWFENGYETNYTIFIVNPEKGTNVGMRCGLGLSPNEDRFTHIDRVLPNWEEFARREYEEAPEGGCYISEEAARTLDAQVGDELLIEGMSFNLVGIFDAERFHNEVAGMDGQPLLIPDYTAMSDVKRQLALRAEYDLAMLADSMQTGTALAPDQNLPRIHPSRMFIFPWRRMRELACVTLRQIVAKTGTVEQARELASQLVDRYAMPVYFGGPGGEVRVLAKTPLMAAPPRSLVILLLLAGLIIFNTMMSSIAERKREIYIYTSLGLAPFHIGVLFLIEALAYGLMGSVLGYVAGQGVAGLMVHLGWMGGMTLNYSGTQAVATMGMVLAFVILASLVPAYLAGKIAVPSNRMRWAVPQPENGLIHDTLPFTVTPCAAPALMQHLRDYFAAHEHGSIGNFTTAAVHIEGEEDATDKGPQAWRVCGSVWLAPYDLGVRQNFTIALADSDESDACAIGIVLEHAAGQPADWLHLNKSFLKALRRQLLGWRGLVGQS